jgi:LytS/YehU family sensor histidine kinase
LLPIFLNRRLCDYPPAIARTLRIAEGGLIGALGYSLAVFGSLYLLSVRLYGADSLGAMLLIEGLIGALITVVVTAFAKLKKDLEASQRVLHDKELHQRALSETSARAQAFALQAQINPHFFFNTLNTISALISVNPDAAQSLIGSLADLFRYTLACSPSDPMTLSQELMFVENYLDVERARFQERLKLDLPRPEGADDIRLPGLTLQPLIENAVRYGIARRVEGGWVKVAVKRNGDYCRISVRNQFDPSEGEPDLRPEKLFREGHALSNVRQRLGLMYGDRASVEIARAESDWVEATLTIPIHKS